MINSPLTNDNHVEIAGKYSVSSIVDAWNENWGIDVSHLFGSSDYISKYKCLGSGLEFFHPPELAADGNVYEQLMTFPWYYLQDKWEYPTTLDLIPNKMKILEVGCGSGHFIEKLQREGHTVTGLELNQEAVENANKKKLDVHATNMEQWAREHKNEYDYVLSYQVLEHIPRPGTFIETCRTLAKPGGHIIFTVPDNDSFIRWDPDNMLNLPPHHMGHWRESVFEKVREIFSFESLICHRSPLEHYHAQWFTYLLAKRFLIWPLPGLASMTLGKILDKSGIVRNKFRGHSIMAIFKKPD